MVVASIANVQLLLWKVAHRQYVKGSWASATESITYDAAIAAEVQQVMVRTIAWIHIAIPIPV